MAAGRHVALKRLFNGKCLCLGSNAAVKYMIPLAQKLLIHVKIFVLPKSAFVLEKPLVKPAGLTIPVEDDV